MQIGVFNERCTVRIIYTFHIAFSTPRIMTQCLIMFANFRLAESQDTKDMLDLKLTCNLQMSEFENF